MPQSKWECWFPYFLTHQKMFHFETKCPSMTIPVSVRDSTNILVKSAFLFFFKITLIIPSWILYAKMSMNKIYLHASTEEKNHLSPPIFFPCPLWCLSVTALNLQIWVIHFFFFLRTDILQMILFIGYI